MEMEPSPESMDLHAMTLVESEAADVDDDEDDYADDSAFENERCGICADVVIDRGVLDCCQHWFCFTCIDNWSTITTLCPLCKNEFQLITCLPVFDTIGSIKAKEHLLTRDDDWSIQGKNNTLSFPSYYIDEDAVICLDGDQCKIRSGLSTAEEDLTFDTSIACDSCDIWYHAFCVGFNPECTTSESSWLCPRCMTEEARQSSNGVLIQNIGKSPPANQLGWAVDPSFSGKVSIFVADAGETAVVVSMVDEQPNSDPCNSFPSEVLDDFKADNKPGASLSDTNSGNVKLDAHVEKNSCNELMCNSSIYSNEEAPNAAPGNENLSEGCLDMSATIVCVPEKVVFNEKSLPFQALKGTPAELTASLPDGLKVPSPSYDNSEMNETSKNKSNIDHKLGLSTTTSSGRMPVSCKMDIIDDKQKKNNKVGNFKRRHREEMQPHIQDAACLTSQTMNGDVESLHPAKKTRSDERSLISPSRSRVNASVSNKAKSSSRIAADKDDYLTDDLLEETDIMSIVQEAHRSHDVPAGSKATHESTDKKDNVTGLRVKKILRRGGEEKESSILIQKLGKEIREAVQDKSHDSIGKPKDFDVKLLTAFRAAIVKPKEELSNKLGPSCIGVKRSFLQKGKIRENLTKKIYGTSTGRRKHAWNRDCEIEFWKHRCSRSKPEKVETLHSVLEALKKATNSSLDTYQGPDGDTTNAILSRVYLADTSVFPRKDDIKPLSALAGSSVTVNESRIAETPAKISPSLVPAKVISSHNAGKRAGTLNFTKQASCGKENLDGMATKSTHMSESSGSKGVQNPKEPGTNSDNTKSDKRKWALEVLARKNASTSLAANRGIEDDKEDTLKRNYPLLAQLPIDMRPLPSPGHHKKVSLPVRQMQLNRIIEHYLRRTNLPLMRRTADTELAVADAVNVEKDIFERSNSKLVYINLCSHALSQSCNKPPSTEAIVLSSTTTEVTDLAEETPSHLTAESRNDVEEALKLAGLLSDSPPSSPCRPTRDANEADDPHGSTGEPDLENVLDMDSRPELDIYGDFEYDLEDEGYIGASTLLQQNDDSKMKVVFSTFKCEESDCANSHKSGNETTGNGQNANNDSIQYGTVNASNEIKTDVILTPKISEEEIYKEPSLAECEELYGPENLSIKNIPEKTTAEIDIPIKVEGVTKSSVSCDSDKYESRGRATTSEYEIVGCAENSFADGRAFLNHESCGTENSPATSLMSNNSPKERKVKLTSNKPPDPTNSISKKVEAYIKEHIRPLCKSGVITAEQYRWAVKKTVDKVMKYHSKAKSASFLIKEGEKVKKLAMDYVEASQQEP